MRRNGQKPIMFTRQPPGTTYTVGAFYWVENDQADAYIQQGLAERYNPPGNPFYEDLNQGPADESDLPSGIPGRSDLIEGGVQNIEHLMDLIEGGRLQDISGIGPKTEEDIIQFLTETEESTDE